MKLIRSGIITRLILLILVVYAIISLINLRTKVESIKAENADLEEQLTLLRYENDRLSYETEHSEEDSVRADIARDKLGLVLPGEEIFYYTGN